MLTTTSHDSVLLRADDPLIDMNYITSFTGMTLTVDKDKLDTLLVFAKVFAG